MPLPACWGAEGRKPCSLERGKVRGSGGGGDEAQRLCSLARRVEIRAHSIRKDQCVLADPVPAEPRPRHLGRHRRRTPTPTSLRSLPPCLPVRVRRRRLAHRFSPNPLSLTTELNLRQPPESSRARSGVARRTLTPPGRPEPSLLRLTRRAEPSTRIFQVRASTSVQGRGRVPLDREAAQPGFRRSSDG